MELLPRFNMVIPEPEIRPVFIVTVVMATIASILVWIRVWIRVIKGKHRKAPEEYFIITAQVIFIFEAAGAFFLRDVSPKYPLGTAFTYAMGTLMYYTVSYVIRIAIIMFHIRITQGFWVQKFAQWTKWAIYVFWVGAYIVYFADCSAKRRFDPDTTEDICKQTLASPEFAYCSTVLLFLDIILTVIPFPAVIKLRGTNLRLAVYIVYSLAIFSISINIFRVVSLGMKGFTNGHERVALLTMVELSVHIIIAAIPGISGPFVSKFVPNNTKMTKPSKGGAGKGKISAAKAERVLVPHFLLQRSKESGRFCMSRKDGRDDKGEWIHLGSEAKSFSIVEGRVEEGREKAKLKGHAGEVGSEVEGGGNSNRVTESGSRADPDFYQGANHPFPAAGRRDRVTQLDRTTTFGGTINTKKRHFVEQEEREKKEAIRCDKNDRTNTTLSTSTYSSFSSAITTSVPINLANVDRGRDLLAPHGAKRSSQATTFGMRETNDDVDRNEINEVRDNQSGGESDPESSSRSDHYDMRTHSIAENEYRHGNEDTFSKRGVLGSEFGGEGGKKRDDTEWPSKMRVFTRMTRGGEEEEGRYSFDSEYGERGGVEGYEQGDGGHERYNSPDIRNTFYGSDLSTIDESNTLC